ncbi:hypothetical protein AS888_00365 [Peribacillus simplex]|uniref:Uncharacterized protein n=1 Tax=Peribacillus simplex TaxID=1478 RepID=A0A109MU96_9BACI|nr:hypothetical protein AS888_00365 [Peribacillus simplex]
MLGGIFFLRFSTPPGLGAEPLGKSFSLIKRVIVSLFRVFTDVMPVYKVTYRMLHGQIGSCFLRGYALDPRVWCWTRQIGNTIILVLMLFHLCTNEKLIFSQRTKG